MSKTSNTRTPESISRLAGIFICTWRRLVLCGLLLRASSVAAEGFTGVEFFEQRVRPILATHCHKCHGPVKQESDLRLGSAVAARKGGVYGRAIVPGKPDNSLLVSATGYRNDDLQMPPKGRLPEEEVAL